MPFWKNGAGLARDWISRRDHWVNFTDTQAGAKIRVVGEAAISCIEPAPRREDSRFVSQPIGRWPFHWWRSGAASLHRVCTMAKIKNVTPHVLRHTLGT